MSRFRSCRTLFAPALALGSIACTSDGYPHLPPLDPSVHSVFVVTMGVQLAVHAYDAALAPSRIAWGDDVRSMIVLHAEQTLDELFLTAGDLELAGPDDCASVPLPLGRAVFRAEAGDELTPISSAGEEIARLRFAVPCPCVDFEVTEFDLPDSVGVRSIISYDPSHQLLITDIGFFLVDREATTEYRAGQPPMWGAFRDQRGTLWLGDIIGQLWTGDPWGELRQTYPSFATLDIVRIAGHVDQDRFELLTITKDRLLERFDGARWEVLYQQEDLSDDQEGELVYLRPGRATAMLTDGDGLLQYDDQRVIPVELEEWNPAESGHLTTLERYGAQGMLIATRTGRLFLRPTEDGGLEEIPDLVTIQERTAIYDIEPFGAGFLEVGRRGYLRQWHPTSGFCPGINLNYQIDLQRIAPFGDVFLVGGNTLEGQPNKGFIIRPIQP